YRVTWWAHALLVLTFLNYLPYSKHLHVATSLFNVFLSNTSWKGERAVMRPMDLEADVAQFGASDVEHLTWKNLLDAYSCTECGRCTAVCPANLTGKKLSPRKIMMDTRDRLEEVGANINKNKTFQPDGKQLINDYISVEELRACTTCQACVEACPVTIDPLSII